MQRRPRPADSDRLRVVVVLTAHLLDLGSDRLHRIQDCAPIAHGLCDAVQDRAYARDQPVLVVDRQPDIGRGCRLWRWNAMQCRFRVGAKAGQKGEAAAAGSRPVLGLIAIGLEHDPRPSRVLGEPRRLRRQIAVIEQGDELMTEAAAVQIRFAMACEVRHGAVKAESDGTNAAHHKRVVLEAAQPHGDFRVLRRERFAWQVWQGLDQDAAMIGVEQRKAGREQMAGEQLRAGDTHQALEADVVPGHGTLDRERLRLDAFNMRAGTLAGQSQHVAIRGTLHQAHAHLLLQRGQSPADCGLRHLQVPGGSGQSAMPRDGQEETEIIPVQHHCPRASLHGRRSKTLVSQAGRQSAWCRHATNTLHDPTRKGNTLVAVSSGRTPLTSDGSEREAVPPARETLRCRTVAAGGFKQLNYVRDLPPLSVEERFGPPADAPVATPSETLLAALGSCLSARIHANAALGNIVVHSLELVLEVDAVTSSMWDPPGHVPSSVGFEAVRVAVNMHADASPDALRALVAHAVLWSPVANTIHDPVHLDVVLGGTIRARAQISGASKG
jgi:uncharacterized OsmC-like protein